MNIHLNGDSRALDEGTTVEGLMTSFRLDARKVAVELNGTILPRSAYGKTCLSDGDRVEIVRFIGGG